MSANQDGVPFVNLQAQHATLRPELAAVMDKALVSASFIGGEEVEGFEREFAAFLGAGHAVGVGSGTDALRLALLAMGAKPGSLAITVANTFIATAEAISQTGAELHLVDVEEGNCLIDPNRLEDLLGELDARNELNGGPHFVVPVHLYGQCADMDAVNELAGRYGLTVLEDAAQAHGARYKGRPAGVLGAAAAFSFYPGKNLGACGEAGAVTTSDPAIASRVAMLRDHGQEKKYHHQAEGYNARLDAIQAGFLRVKLGHLEKWNQARREIAAAYDQAFADLEWLEPVRIESHNVSVYHLYVVHTSRRDELAEHLGQRNIQWGLHYPVPLHLQPCYARLGLGTGSFPRAEASAASLLSLPMFPEMTMEQRLRVIDAVREFGEGR